jgi:hypothetical protein
MQAYLREVFDRPTPWIVNSPWVERVKAEQGSLMNMAVLPTHDRKSGGKTGVDPQQVLQTQEFGGRRADKKSEVRLRVIGLLPTGYQTSIPDNPYPGSADEYGNIRGAFMQRLLSYLQAYDEQGYKANMKRRAKEKFEGAAAYSNIKTRKQHMLRQQRFFVVQPRSSIVDSEIRETLPSPDGRGEKSLIYSRANDKTHLAPGIWAARGTHGVDVRPVLMFVRTPNYTPRLDWDSLYGRNEDYLAQRLRYRIRKAAGE